MQAKIQAQDAAGRLVFQGDELPVQVATEEQPVSPSEAPPTAQAEVKQTKASGDASERYVQSPEATSTTLR